MSTARWSLQTIRERGSIAILSPREPQEFALLVAMDDKEAMLLNGVEETFLLQADLAKRYVGTCLVPTPAFASKTANPLVIGKPLALLKTTGSDAILTGTIALRNQGTESLTVNVASETCSCYGAQPELSSPVIAPGGMSVLTVPIRPRAGGTESAIVVLSTTNPSFPQYVVNIRAVAPQVVSASPSKVFTSTREGTAWSSELTVRLPPGAKIQRMYARNDFVRMKAIPKTKQTGSSNSSIALFCPPDTAPGDIADEIVFELAGAEVPSFVVPVTGQVQPDITASSPQLFLGEVQKGVVLNRTIILESASKKPFYIWSVATSDPDVSVVIPSKGKSASKEIQVAIRVNGEGVFQQEIILMVGHWRKITIPITAMIKDAGMPNPATKTQ
ncbi:MAG: hypothetical protein H8F28_24900 [Fibrella sp.]|nr:hypothetical protein [Armatimonadota bacterium]